MVTLKFQKKQTIEKLDATRVGILQSILSNSWFNLLYFCLLLLILFSYISIKIRKITDYATEQKYHLKNFLESYENQTRESMLMFAILLKNDKIRKVLNEDPDLLRRFQDFIDKTQHSISKREKISKKTIKKQ